MSKKARGVQITPHPSQVIYSILPSISRLPLLLVPAKQMSQTMLLDNGFIETIMLSQLLVFLLQAINGELPTHGSILVKLLRERRYVVRGHVQASCGYPEH